MEVMEQIAVELTFGGDEFKCPFPHSPRKHTKKNEIPPEVENSGDKLGAKLEGSSHHLETAKISPPFEIAPTVKIDVVGYAANHVIPGNEIWNDKGHPLHAWVHKRVEDKVKGDIKYINNESYNGVDLPSHFLIPGW